MSSDRREFLGQVAAFAVGGGVLGSSAARDVLLGVPPEGAARTAVAADQATATTATTANTSARGTGAAAWDMAWVDQLPAAKHKAVFDATMITSGIAMGHVDIYLKNYQEVYAVGERDMRAVLVLRHEAVPIFLNDAFWRKYALGTRLKLNDPATGVATLRNYYAAGGATPVPELVTLESLSARGVILLGCYKALMSVAALMAQATGTPAETVQADAKAAVLPYVTLMPSGIFAATRAQEAGCQYIRST